MNSTSVSLCRHCGELISKKKSLGQRWYHASFPYFNNCHLNRVDVMGLSKIPRLNDCYAEPYCDEEVVNMILIKYGS